MATAASTISITPLPPRPPGRTVRNRLAAAQKFSRSAVWTGRLLARAPGPLRRRLLIPGSAALIAPRTSTISLLQRHRGAAPASVLRGL